MAFDIKIKRISWGLVKKLTPLSSAVQNAMANGGSLDAITKAMDEFQTAIAPLILSIGADALVDDAPKTLDWKDPASQDWLDRDAMKQLIQMVIGAEESAKN